MLLPNRPLRQLKAIFARLRRDRSSAFRGYNTGEKYLVRQSLSGLVRRQRRDLREAADRFAAGDISATEILNRVLSNAPSRAFVRADSNARIGRLLRKLELTTNPKLRAKFDRRLNFYRKQLRARLKRLE